MKTQERVSVVCFGSSSTDILCLKFSSDMENIEFVVSGVLSVITFLYWMVIRFPIIPLIDHPNIHSC